MVIFPSVFFSFACLLRKKYCILFKWFHRLGLLLVDYLEHFKYILLVSFSFSFSLHPLWFPLSLSQRHSDTLSVTHARCVCQLSGGYPKNFLKILCPSRWAGGSLRQLCVCGVAGGGGGCKARAYNLVARPGRKEPCLRSAGTAPAHCQDTSAMFLRSTKVEGSENAPLGHPGHSSTRLRESLYTQILPIKKG